MSTEAILTILGIGLPGLGAVMWWMYRRLWTTNDKEHAEIKAEIKDVEKEADDGRRAIHGRIENLTTHISTEYVPNAVYEQGITNVNQNLENLRVDFRTFGKSVEKKFDTLNENLIEVIKNSKIKEPCTNLHTS